MLKFLKPSICLIIVFLLLSQPCFAFVNQPIPLIFPPPANLPSITNATIANLMQRDDFPDSKTLRKFVPNFLAAVGINSPSKLMFTSFHKFGAHLERYDNGSLAASYVYGEGIDEALTMNRGAQTYYYFYDGLGSVTDISDNSGNVVENYQYDVYGQPNITSTIGNRFMFTGREYDEESGLYYLRARYYSPTIGRFLQREPIGMVDGPNPYTYCLNDPVNWLDPLGLYRYSTTNWGIASLHESNPFNADSAMRQQMSSWGKFYTGNWAGAAAISGQSIVGTTNRCGKASGWQIGYNAAQIVTAAAALTAAGIMAGPVVSSALVKAKVSTLTYARNALASPWGRYIVKQFLPPLLAAWMRWAAMEMPPPPVFWQSTQTAITTLIK